MTNRATKSQHHVNAVIRVYDDAGNVIETHEHKGDFKEPYGAPILKPYVLFRKTNAVLINSFDNFREGVGPKTYD